EMLELARTKDLDQVLAEHVGTQAHLAPAAAVVREVASAAAEMADLVSLGRLAGEAGATTGGHNHDGDAQKQLDILAHDLFVEALRRAPVAAVLSEEMHEPQSLQDGAPLAVAIDPLDGSSNIETNVSVGTIFSILSAVPGADLRAHFLQHGHAQLAAGFFIYGPQTALVLAFGEKTRIFVLDRRRSVFREITEAVQIPPDSPEYAINASNYRHWGPSIQAFIDDCVKGMEGPLRKNHNMRWVASLVAEAYRILNRGGVFLYPGDMRAGYSAGRLRLLYEANPIALIVEYAGGAATDSVRSILSITPNDLHARTPLVFGSMNVVNLIKRYHTDPQFSAERSPLFGRRGLIRQ
ncbi:MAG TPA: class 1 fructose-bisphosphatase, partial [Methylovirgula sp.]